MRITKKTLYAIIALTDLAKLQEINNSPVLLRNIHEKNGISLRFLENIFVNLRVAGILKSFKGKDGGFMLNKSPEEITLFEIIESLEEPLVRIEKDLEQTVVKELFNGINEKLKDIFTEITLQDIIDLDINKPTIEYFI